MIKTQQFGETILCTSPLSEKKKSNGKESVAMEGDTKKREMGKFALLYGVSFGLPIIVLLFILKSRGFYPFGEKTLFIMDMKDQYLEFYASLRNVAGGDDSLFFSWSRSMGGNYLGLFAYYVASPLSFLTTLFPVGKLPAAIVLLTLLKTGLAGASFAHFGQYVWRRAQRGADPDKKFVKKSDKKSDTRRDEAGFANGGGVLVVIPLAVSYALLSYNMVYSMCLMWLDGVIFLPLVLLGVEKILDGCKGFWYMVSLAALFVCNYYTGYMVGIFTGIYTVYGILYRLDKKNPGEYGRKLLRVGSATLLALGLSAPILLPVVMDLRQGKLSTVSYRPDTEVNFVLGELLGKLRNGAYDSITNSGLPTIYCGYVVFALAIFFFCARRVSLREKALAFLVLALFICSFYYTKWDMVWHGFQYPNWFPYRYAFLWGFFLVYLALKGLAFGGGCAGKDKMGKGAYRNSMIAFWSENIRKHAWLVVAAVTVAAAADLGSNGEAMFAGLERQFGYGSVEEYEAFLDSTKPLVDFVKEKDSGLYRVNQGYEYSKNDAMLLGYHGMTHYSSTFHGAVNTLSRNLGLAQAHIWNSGYGSNPLLDSLFGVKYILEDGQAAAGYVLRGSTEEGTAVYENPNVLPFVYAASCNNLDPEVSSQNPYANQNALLQAIAGSQYDYFTEYEYNKEAFDTGWSYTFRADSTDPVYLYMRPVRNAWANVYVNDLWVGNYFSTETNCSLYLGNFQPGEQVAVKIMPSGEAAVSSAAIARLHMAELEQTLDCLRQNGMRMERHGYGKITGTIYVGENQKIITSIPYEEGWTVWIDGRKAVPIKFAGTFLALEAESGEHSLSFSYVSPGFWTGMGIFMIAALGAALYFGLPVGRKQSLNGPLREAGKQAFFS